MEYEFGSRRISSHGQNKRASEVNTKFLYLYNLENENSEKIILVFRDGLLLKLHKKRGY